MESSPHSRIASVLNATQNLLLSACRTWHCYTEHWPKVQTFSCGIAKNIATITTHISWICINSFHLFS